MKKRNEEEPDIQEDNDEDALELLNSLLERLHLLENEKKSKSENEKSIVINIYKPGSQHVDRVENQYIGASPQQPLPNPFQREREEGKTLPDVFSTGEAMALWEKVQRAGYVDDNYQPLISRTQSALLADVMAGRLGIREKWKVFEVLWNRKNMYHDYYQALGQQKTLIFQDELKKVLA